ncbi:MAG: SIMPL domain-containing protein [Gemmobacter sp.]|nr:SIMPL domain-containing protein [Gemmobacter sp.]
MRIPLTPFLPLMALAIGLSVAALPARADSDTRSKMTVTGEGRVDSAPDMAVITLGVATEAQTAAAALSENSTRLAAVLDRLRASGIADRDLQTSGLNLGPQMEYAEGRAPRIIGYAASNNLTVRVRDLSALGGVLDTAVSDGANTFNGLTFGLSDPMPALDGARTAAVADARRKAQMIADAAGVRLGDVIDISESVNSGGPAPMFRDSKLAMAESVPVAGGEVSHSVNVSITWELNQ